MRHSEPSPLAGLVVTIKADAAELGGQKYRVEDWWDRVAGKSWMVSDGNPACLHYAMRGHRLPMNDEVLYGKVGPFGKLVHITEIELPQPSEASA